jgi:hypothetical protein
VLEHLLLRASLTSMKAEDAVGLHQFAEVIEADRARLITACDQEEYRSDQSFGVTTPGAA